MNKVGTVTLNKIKQQATIFRKKQIKDTISAWLKHQTL